MVTPGFKKNHPHQSEYNKEEKKIGIRSEKGIKNNKEVRVKIKKFVESVVLSISESGL
jgi:hypothetical protein